MERIINYVDKSILSYYILYISNDALQLYTYLIKNINMYLGYDIQTGNHMLIQQTVLFIVRYSYNSQINIASNPSSY